MDVGEVLRELSPWVSGMASYYPGADEALSSCSEPFGTQEAERAVGYELWLLVHDEVPGP
jgi:hypothetical protein